MLDGVTLRWRAFGFVAISMCAACSSGAAVPAGAPGAATRVAAEPRGGAEPRATASPGPTFSIALPVNLQGTVKSATVTTAPLGGTTSAPILLACTTMLCTGAVAPPAGTDVFVATLYPAANGSGKSLAAGTLVSTVGAGPVAPIDVSFGAAFAKLTLLLSKTTIVGGTAAQVSVLPEALDAAGNTIIGPYTSGISLADSDASGATKLSATTLTASPAAPLVFSYNGALIANPTLSARAPNVKTVASLVTITVTARELAWALNAVETYYSTLPHRSLAADLASTVADLAKSAAFSTATVTEGGLDVTFANGVKGLIFADRVVPQFVHPLPSDGFISAPNGHEIAFLANESGDETFYPKRQHDFAAAFVRDGFTPAGGYGVDAMNISLDNIVALGNSKHAIDFLDVSTHAALDAAGAYHWQSTTPLTDAGLKTFASDIASGTVTPSLALSNAYLDYLPSFAFTANFLAEHLTFNKGAILDNQSCCGEDVNITAGPQQLSKVGLGRYYGWTARVAPNDADESDAFLFDRLLGERLPSVTGLNAYAGQRRPAQRPFPLDAVFGVMQTENRNSPIQTPPGYAYTYSPPLGDSVGSHLLATDFGGEYVAGAPIEYALPSIERLQLTEATSTLEIVGRFPAMKGSVSIAGSYGWAAPNASTWNSAFILLPIATSGPGSWGTVTVQSSGIASNPVPLTQWAGTLNLSGSDPNNGTGRYTGKGTLSGTSTYATLFRSDVHPTVAAIDTQPQAQDFYFSNLEAGTTGAFTAFASTFAQYDPCGAEPKPCSGYSESLLPSPPAMHSLRGTSYFSLTPVTSPPATCNSGLAGPHPGVTNVFCASFTAYDSMAASCTRANSYDPPEGMPFCGSTGKSLVPIYGAGSLLTLVMNAVTYAVSLRPNPARNRVTIDQFFPASLSAQFQAPLGAPPASPSGGV